MATELFVARISVPAPIGIAEVAFLLAAFHGDLMVLHATLDQASKQRLGPLLPINLLTACRKNNGRLV